MNSRIFYLLYKMKMQNKRFQKYNQTKIQLLLFSVFLIICSNVIYVVTKILRAETSKHGICKE